MAQVTLRLGRPLDLWATLGPLQHGPYDPTIHLTAGGLWRASRTPQGPATLHAELRARERTVSAEAWGPGAAWELEHLPELLGETDDPDALRPVHPFLAELARRSAGLRLPRTNRLLEALLPAVCEQKITGLEAQRIYRRIVRAVGESGPGPAAATGLLLSPDPTRLAALPYHAFHPLGLERRRAEVLIQLGRRATAIERLVAAVSDEARRGLVSLPGIGPWSAAEAIRIALGDPDALSLGDYGLPSLVAWALAGERQADDERMLELLAPYAGQRARVVRLLEVAGAWPPRRGPRTEARRIEAL
ncbi:MAG TPA: hypothetical protein VFW92_08615 [Candidatus Limnocylindrales bacterium]|nr:hypothetical protein [Candidatus Limnocylindrales bacterium]